MRRAATGVLVIVFWVLAAPVALAHDDVIGTSPRNGDQLTSAPAEVRIRFSADASPRSGKASITGPRGNSVAAGPAKVEGSTLVIPMRPTTVAGRYAVKFRTLSSDGHPVAGSITVELVITKTPATSPTPSTAAPRPATDAAVDAPVWPWLAVAGLAGLAVAAIALVRKASRTNHD